MSFLLSISGVILALVFTNLCVNLLTFRRLLPKELPDDPSLQWPLVSILVPARNEEANIRRCIESLLGQNYPRFEVIVLDDCSEDRTSEILEKIKTEHPRGDRLKILEGHPLRDGWIGKCWACQQLADAAAGEWLLFTDADTWHHAGALASALTLAEDEQADLLSAWPRQLTETFGEQLAVPMVHLILLGYCPLWLLNAVQSPRMIAACGQFVLWKADSYRRIGGHESVKAHLVEDVALAGQVMRHGLRLLNADANKVISTRMYQGFGALWRGFTKNFYTGFGGHPFPFFLFLALQTGPFLTPWVDLLIGVFGATTSFIAAIMDHLLAIFLILFSFLIHGLPAIRFKQKGWSVLLYPLSELIVLAVGASSFLQTRSRQGVEWKGRLIASKR